MFCIVLVGRRGLFHFLFYSLRLIILFAQCCCIASCFKRQACPLPLAFFISIRWSHNSDALRQQAFRFLLLYWRAWGGPLPTSFHNTALCFLSAIMICIILGSPRKGLSTNMFTIGSDVRFRVEAARIWFDFQFGLQSKTAWVLNWLCRVVSICFYCCVMLSNPTMKHRH